MPKSYILEHNDSEELVKYCQAIIVVSLEHA